MATTMQHALKHNTTRRSSLSFAAISLLTVVSPRPNQPTKMSDTPASNTNTMAAANNTPADIHEAVFGEQEKEEVNRYAKYIQHNPLVPIFIGATGVSLIGGFWAFKSGNQQWSQNFQRARVFFQGGVVAALVASTWRKEDHI
eukprot:m.94175 g.94175  ORF g.94175 m.94175 type:complete len:143 (+) comp13017_c0_seq2:56-484(+)